MDVTDGGRSDAPARVVGIGASAGGLDALIELVRELPPGLSAAICIVLHVPSSGRSLLAPIPARHTPLSVDVAQHGVLPAAEIGAELIRSALGTRRDPPHALDLHADVAE